MQRCKKMDGQQFIRCLCCEALVVWAGGAHRGEGREFTLMQAWGLRHQEVVPSPLVIYLFYLKKKVVRSDASSMIVIFVECVIVIPNSYLFF